jgi:hypothetical protein
VSDTLGGLLNLPEPSGTGFAVKSFVHSLLGVPKTQNDSSLPQDEDVIFSFQERLCAIFEVEIETDTGTSLQVFPTRLNTYLDTAVADPQCSATFAKPKRKNSLPVQKGSAVPVARKKPDPASPPTSQTATSVPQSAESDSGMRTAQPPSPPRAAARNPSDVKSEFNVSATDLQFVFASVSKEPRMTDNQGLSPRSLAAALVRADSSEDSN